MFFAGMLSLLISLLSVQAQDSLKVLKLNEVLVEASRNDARLGDIPQKIEIISRENIQSLPHENLAEVLKRTTNLDIIQYPGLSASIGMRGFSPSAHSRSYTLLLLDGKPAGTTNLSTLMTEQIERIEIVKGPYAVLYGSDAMAGVINVITRKPSGQTSGSVSAQAGSFGFTRLSGEAEGALGENTHFALQFSRLEQQKDYRIGTRNFFGLSETHRHLHDKNSYGDVMKNTRYQTQQVGANLGYTPAGNWSANGQLQYTFANDIETPGNYWGSYGQSKKDINRMNVYGSLRRVSETNSFSLSPYFARENNPFYSSNAADGFINFNSQVSEYGIKLHDRQQWGSLIALVGLDMDIHAYQSERFSEKGKSTNPYKPDYRNAKTAVFGQLSYTWQRWLVNAGARLDYIGYDLDANELLGSEKANERYHAFNPSLGVQYKLNSAMRLRGSYGTAFSVPDAFKVAGYYSVSEYFPAWDFWWVKDYVGNPELKPETSATWDVGFNLVAPQSRLSFDLTYFSTRHRDKIVEYKNAEGKTTYRNANRALMEGLEVMLQSDLGAWFGYDFKLEPYVAYTWMLTNDMENRVKNSAGEEVIQKREMLFTRKANGHLGLVFDNRKHFSTRVHARYIGTRLESDSFSALRPKLGKENYYTAGGYEAKDKILKHPAYLVFDYSVYYTLHTKTRFGISVSNLFDENYTEKDGYNMPGRMITGSVTYRF